jgi:hypothetical protein
MSSRTTVKDARYLDSNSHYGAFSKWIMHRRTTWTRRRSRDLVGTMHDIMKEKATAEHDNLEPPSSRPPITYTYQQTSKQIV